MGIWSGILSLFGCATSSGPPALADYEAVLQTGRALSLDPTVGTSGRYQIVAGDRAVLRLHVVRGGSAFSHDKQSDWSIVVELPAPGPGGKAAVGAIAVDALPSVARVAGEDVVYLARGAHGTAELSIAGSTLSGTIDLSFASPDRDFIKLGPLKLAGKVSGRVEP